MSDPRRTIDMLIDVDSGKRSETSGATDLVEATGVQVLYRGTQILFRCILYVKDQSTSYNPPAGAVWLFGIDSAFTRDHADLAVSDNAQFNIPGDWADYSPTTGKICWRSDLTADLLKDDLADAADKTMYACLWMIPTGGKYTLMAQWEVKMKNIAVDPTTAIPQEGITYPTMDVYNADLGQIKTPTGGLYRLKNGALQLYNAEQAKFHTVSVAGAAGSELISIGPGED